MESINEIQEEKIRSLEKKIKDIEIYLNYLATKINEINENINNKLNDKIKWN